MKLKFNLFRRTTKALLKIANEHKLLLIVMLLFILPQSYYMNKNLKASFYNDSYVYIKAAHKINRGNLHIAKPILYPLLISLFMDSKEKDFLPPKSQVKSQGITNQELEQFRDMKTVRNIIFLQQILGIVICIILYYIFYITTYSTIIAVICTLFYRLNIFLLQFEFHLMSETLSYCLFFLFIASAMKLIFSLKKDTTMANKIFIWTAFFISYLLLIHVRLQYLHLPLLIIVSLLIYHLLNVSHSIPAFRLKLKASLLLFIIGLVSILGMNFITKKKWVISNTSYSGHLLNHLGYKNIYSNFPSEFLEIGTIYDKVSKIYKKEPIRSSKVRERIENTTIFKEYSSSHKEDRFYKDLVLKTLSRNKFGYLKNVISNLYHTVKNYPFMVNRKYMSKTDYKVVSDNPIWKLSYKYYSKWGFWLFLFILPSTFILVFQARRYKNNLSVNLCKVILLLFFILGIILIINLMDPAGLARHRSSVDILIYSLPVVNIYFILSQVKVRLKLKKTGKIGRTGEGEENR